MHNDLDNLIPLMKKKGVTASKEEFHNIVNTVFHNIEARSYDNLHSSMDDSLQEQFDLLGGDILRAMPSEKSLHLLDVGCGTGMSTEKLLKSPIGKHISKIYLLDTSSGMLEQCRKKAEKWNVPFEIIEGDIYSINISADIILTCSVLHHIPNLSPFLQKIASLQNKNGVYVHLQDPNGDHLSSPDLQARKAELKSFLKAQELKKNPVGTIVGKIFRKLRKIAGMPLQDAYIEEVNAELIKKGLIKKPMTDTEIWSVTDLHVEGLPNAHGKGISLNFLKKELGQYKLINMRSYGFFGVLKSELPAKFQKKEQELIADNQIGGHELAAVWQRQ